MSKRFGRNQRRRAREALAAAQQEIDSRDRQIGGLREVRQMDRALLDQQARELREARDFARDVARAVGRSCVYAGVALPQSFHADRYEAATYGMRVALPPEIRHVDAFGSTVMLTVEQVRYEVIRLLDIQAVRDQLRGQMHFRVQLAGGVVGYAISEMALTRMPREELERRLVPEMAAAISRLLSEEVKKKFP
jgi:hypothetical protein